MRVGVLGGYGFVGSHLVDELLERGDEVLVFDDLSSCWLDAEFDLEPLFANPEARRVEELSELATCEVLVNLALRHPLERDLELFRKAVAGYVGGFAQLMIDAAKTRILRRVVVGGAIEALDGTCETPLARIVRAAREVLAYLHRPPRLDVEFVHLPELYGPRQLPEAGWVAALLNDATMTTEERFGNLAFVGDAARLLADRAAERKHRTSLYVALSAPVVSPDDVLAALVGAPVSAGELLHFEGTAERFRTSERSFFEAGGIPATTSLEDGLIETIRFYREVEA